MTYKEIIDKILTAKLKSGKPVVSKPDHIKLLERFKNFNPTTDWIEGKELTKDKKTLTSYLYKVFLISPADDPDYTSSDLRGYKTDDLYYALDKIHISPYYTANSKKSAEKINKNREELLPLVEHVKAMDKRIMRNGVLPKAEREQKEREQIKGELNPFLRSELERLKEKWYHAIYEYHKDWLTDMRKSAVAYIQNNGNEIWSEAHFPIDRKKYTPEQEIKNKHNQNLRRYLGYGVVKWGQKNSEGLVPVSDEQIDKDAERTAKLESDAWFFKMVDKLGGLVMDFKKTLKSVRDGAGIRNKATPFDAWFVFEFTDGSRFELKNSIVMSRSVKGTPFYRYPATFHDAYISNGEKVKNPDEYTVKLAFMRDAGMEKMPEKLQKASSTYYQYTLHLKDEHGNFLETVTLNTRTKWLTNKEVLDIVRYKGFVKTEQAKKGKLKFSGHAYTRRGSLPEYNSIESVNDIQETIRAHRDKRKEEGENNPPKAEDGILLPTGKEVTIDELPDYKKEEVGGYLAGVNESGNIVVHEDGDKGGMLIGNRHAVNNGIAGHNISTNSTIYVETGEASITSKAVLDKTKHEFDGKQLSNREILSTINKSGGGVAFAEGGVTVKAQNRNHTYDGENLSEHEMFNRMNKI